jgi:membrane dipeptidase
MKHHARFSTLLLALLSAAMICARTVAQGDIDARARAIHQRIVAIDSHVDVLLPSTPEQYFTPGHSSRSDLDKLRRGGIGAAAFAIAVGPARIIDAATLVIEYDEAQ